MKFKSAMGAALLATFIYMPSAYSNTSGDIGRASSAPDLETEYGQTLPPVGYVKFCASTPELCKSPSSFTSMVAKPVDMTAERWTSLYQVNTSVNAAIAPVSDQDQYGEPERWALPANGAGDCEDYALLKQQRLQQQGFPANSLRMTVVLDEHDEGHAVLTLVTAQGDYILDNRRNDILLWKDTRYTFLKRQSAEDPKHWVALVKTPAVAAPAVASAQKR